MVIFTRRSDKQQVAVSGKTLRDFLSPGRTTPGLTYRYSILDTTHAYRAHREYGHDDVTVKAGEAIRFEYTFQGCAGYAVFKHLAGIDQDKPARFAWHFEKAVHITL